jgi:hypothetical protein
VPGSSRKKLIHHRLAPKPRNRPQSFFPPPHRQCHISNLTIILSAGRGGATPLSLWHVSKLTLNAQPHFPPCGRIKSRALSRIHSQSSYPPPTACFCRIILTPATILLPFLTSPNQPIPLSCIPALPIRFSRILLHLLESRRPLVPRRKLRHNLPSAPVRAVTAQYFSKQLGGAIASGSPTSYQTSSQYSPPIA